MDGGSDDAVRRLTGMAGGNELAIPKTEFCAYNLAAIPLPHRIA